MSPMTSSTTLPTHPTRRHPHSGLALQAVGFRRSGAPIWPILGASPDDPPAPPERPEGVSEDEWAALGDPGRAAIVREREARQTAERALAAARARPAPPKSDPPKTDPAKTDPPAGGTPDPLDVAAIVQQAVDAAIRPFAEREAQRDAQSAAQKIADEVVEAAKARLHDSSDALTNIDLTKVVTDQGTADQNKITAALDDLVKRKPHLAKSTHRIAPHGIGGGGGGAAVPEPEQVKALLAQMQQSAGIRLTSTN